MTPTNVREALAELVGKALNRAWSLGQTYWQQADSASYRENARAHATRGIYEALREETLAALASHPSPAPQSADVRAQAGEVTFEDFDDRVTVEAIRALGIRQPTVRQIIDLQKAMALALRLTPEPREPAQPAVAVVTDEMVTAYLTANDSYWKEADSLPLQNPSKWRNGTTREATRVSLEAALLAAPSAQPAPEQGEAVAEVCSVVGAGPNDVGIRWRGGIVSVGTKLYAAPQPAPEKAEAVAPKYLYPEASAVPFDYVMTILREAGDHLGRVMEDHPHCDHVHVVKAFGDVWRKTHGYVPRPTHPEQKAEAAVPAGWKLVPVEPTWAMEDAGSAAGDGHDWSGPVTVWAAMLAAAPTPTEGQA